MPAKEHYFMDYKVKLQLGNRGNHMVRTWSASKTQRTAHIHSSSPLSPNFGEQGMAQWWEQSPPTRGSGSNLGVDAICGLSLLLVISFAPRGFFSGYSGFPLSSKTNPSKFQFDQESNQVDEETLCGCATSKSLFIIYLFIRHPL